MAKTFNTIIKDFDKHLSKSGRRHFSDFYIGITKDIQQRFREHNVSTERAWWIYRTATSPNVARKVEEHYLKKGMRGKSGDGTRDSNIVYCYAVGPTTTELNFKD